MSALPRAAIDPSPDLQRSTQAPPEGRVTDPDPTRVLRAKALACTAPLHDLQRNRGLHGWDDFDLYDLSLAAIDLVVDRMGFDSGIGADELVAALIPRAAYQLGGGMRQPAREVAEGVVAALVRPNTAEYTSDLDAVRRQFDFALLTEHERADSSIYLRATSQAINVLVGGLNVDVESAQIAAEATLEHLLRRQRFADAAVPAREARIRSVQYAEFVRGVIEDTKRDVHRAGWRESVPERLAEIRAHLTERMETERKLLAAMQDTRDSAEREDLRQHAAALVETVNDCFERHSHLHRVTLEAARVYIEERDRQAFGRISAVQGVDLTEEFLLPALAAPVKRVEMALTAFAEHLLGMGPGSDLRVTPWRQPSLGVLMGDLLRLANQRDEVGEEITEPTWEEPTSDPFAFDEPTSALAEDILEDLATPQLLSGLLQRACRSGFDVADLVRLQALLATAPEILASPPGRRILVAARVGKSFTDGSFAGDDLLIGNAVRLSEAEPSPGIPGS